jgi:hypothetical protein
MNISGLSWADNEVIFITNLEAIATFYVYKIHVEALAR